MHAECSPLLQLCWRDVLVTAACTVEVGLLHQRLQPLSAEAASSKPCTASCTSTPWPDMPATDRLR